MQIIIFIHKLFFFSWIVANALGETNVDIKSDKILLLLPVS